MMKINAALNQLIWVTCDSAKKYSGDRNMEKGIRKSLIVAVETILIVKIVSYEGPLKHPVKYYA
jgi:hypothetical protein